MAAGKTKWIYLFVLSLIWGSSFILIKKGLVGLSPLQVGAFRVIFAALFLILVGFKKIIKLKSAQWKWIVVSGFVGSFFPIFLFAFAETKISSGIASILNAVTPLMTLILGFLFFQDKMNSNKAIGVLVGLIGTAGLILSNASFNGNENYLNSILGVLAAVCYAVNVNLLKKYLSGIPAVAVTSGCFAVLLVPAFLILIWSGFFTEDLTNIELQKSVGFISILGVLGTGVAMILFNRLVQITNPVFTSSVTYTMPIIALGWGVMDDEVFSLNQLFFAMLVIIGVLIVNRAKAISIKRKKRLA
ncbi:DMT family transporter [Zunongwangia sp. SCSIO 43204]|uniref:DMT family transporter n=1 Tax=Zunongwangia sp. SCSIO 43204 TaxID=2779359 RepID=UPI001CA7BA90|nr:DMT family transporter [Zunongwangia sp. SCSIO 43204]UAB85547.1 DMT family transporter [Zunongwangia sp. SCSIO 43204]